MAKKFYDKKIDKTTDWGGDESTGNLPVVGSRVQEFIKETFNKKLGESEEEAISFALNELNNRISNLENK